MKIIKNIQNFLGWERAPRPQVSLNGELYAQFTPFRLPIILILLTMMLGTFGYMIIEDYSLINAIFQTGYTFTTVGFGSLNEGEFSPAGKLFTVTLIIVGFTILTFSVGILIEVVNKGDILRLFKERKMLYQVARLKNHYVICYHNEYTIEVTKSLRAYHIPFVVVDPNFDPDVAAKEYGYPYAIKGDPHTETSMLKVNLSSAKGAILLSNSIADNIAMIASIRLFQEEHFVPREYFLISNAENKSDEDKLRKLGANSVVTPTKLTAQRVTAMAARPDLENMMEEFLVKTSNPIIMEEIFVPKYSWMVLKKIKETHLREIASVSIIGIRDKSNKFYPMPKGNMLVTGECKLLIVGTHKGMSYTKRIVDLRNKPEELRFA